MIAPDQRGRRDGAKMQMNRLSVALFVVTGLMLTAYFGTAAWRLSAVSNTDILDGLPSVPHTGWSTTATRR
jgi:hypothetical protein